MPGKVKVKILQGKNLPVMDRSSDTTDAYVEIKLGNTTYKTDVCRKSLNPQWNSEWYRFEVDDSELQDEPLQIRVMDHDTYSANDAIGKVYLNLNPLLLPAGGHLMKYGYNTEGNMNHDNSKNSVMSGWIPVYDTMHGIRGEVNVIVKVELFSDFNKFRQSSCGVQFFCSPTVPHGYYAEVIHGFVEELIVNADPEYQWIDKIRTPRATNEARQTLFFKLSGELQRKIGVKALNLGGNAVIGYNQRFDLEGESGIVARGIGTAVTLVKVLDVNQLNDSTNNEERALNYLKFVGCGKNFHLNVHPFKCNLLIPTPKPIYLQNPPRKLTSRHQKLFKRNKHVLVTKSSPTLTLQTSLTSLLKQEDERGTPGSGISQRIKNLKYSSQNSLSRKMTALKAKLGDSGIGEEHEVTLINPKKLLKQKKEFHRANSDSSVMAELLAKSVIDVHNSLTCILEGQHSDSPHEEDTLEKLKPVSKLLSKCVSESNLSSNDKKQDNLYLSSDSSTSDDDEDDEEDDDTMDEIQNIEEFDSISDIINKVHILEQNRDVDKLHTKYSISPLVISNDQDSYVSAIEDKSDSNQNEEDNTQSNVLVAAHNAPDSIEKTTLVDTALQTMLLEKVNALGTYTPPTTPKSNYDADLSSPVMNIGDKKNHSLVNTAMQTMLLDKFNLLDNYTPPTSPKSFNFIKPTQDMFFEIDLDKPVDQEQIEHEKVSNENTKSFKEPRKLIAPIEIISDTHKNSLMNTAMQTMLLEKVNLLGTSTPPIVHEQIFDFDPISHQHQALSNTQNDTSSLINEKIKRIKHSQKKLSPTLTNVNLKSSSLVNSAMRTMLIEKANLAETIGTEPISTEGFHFTEAPSELKPSEDHENIHNLPQLHTDTTKDNSFINTAMKTMLLDRINIVESFTPPTSPVPAVISSKQTDEESAHMSSNNSVKNDSLIGTAMQTMLLEKANLVETIGTEPISTERFHFTEVPVDVHEEKEVKHHIEEHHKGHSDVLTHGKTVKNNSLINAAMKTMLLERLNIVESFTPPTSPILADISSITSKFRDDPEKQINTPLHAEEIKEHSLTNTAMQTMLLEKANLVETIGTEPISTEDFHFTSVPVEKNEEKDVKQHTKENHKEDLFHAHSDSVKNNSMINAAMKTMLLDRVNIVESFTPPSSPIPAVISSLPAAFRDKSVTPSNIERKTVHTDNVKEHSLVNTAMETMLLEKANLLETIGTDPISTEGFHFTTAPPELQEAKEKATINQEHFPPLSIKNNSLINTAMKSMLLDRVNIVETFTSPTLPVPAIISPEKNDEKIMKEDGVKRSNLADNEINNINLFNTALQTVLLEKVNIFETSASPNTSPEIKDNANVNFSHYEGRSNINNKEILNNPILEKVANFSISPQGSSSSIPEAHLRQEHEPVNDAHASQDESKVIKKPSKILIPPIMIGANIKNTSLINTAMQTILLDKVNILGTYTPPTSPNSEDASLASTSPLSFNKTKNVNISEMNQRKLIKSTTSASFNEYLRKNDTVLGVPFTSITAIKKDLLKKQISHPCLYSIQEACVKSNNSFENDNKPTSVEEITTDKPSCFSKKSNKFKFFSMIMEKTRSNPFINETGKYMKSINVFKHKKKIKSDKENVKSTRPRFLSMLHLHKKATTKSDSQMPIQLNNKNNSQSSPCVLIITNSIDTNTSSQPANIEIEQGFCENNKETCLTPFRNNTPPPSTYEHSQISRQSPEPPPRMSHSPAKFYNTTTLPTGIYRRSSDSDLSITPKGNSLTGSDRSGGAANCNSNRNNIVLRSTIHQDNFDMLEYPFLTMTKFPLGFIVQLGGAISARSVKLLERNTNMEEPESRNDIWWSEIRMEIRSHARSLNCNAVLGYTETTSICEDVCVLSASGTAAVISFQYTEEVEENVNTQSLAKSHMTTSLDRNHFDKDKYIPKYIESNNRTLYESPEHLNSNSTTTNTIPQHFTACTLAHLPYETNNVPVRVTVVKCGICMRGKVPDVLIATIEPPESIPSSGKGCFVESIISRPLKDLKGESLAKDISDGLPFLEYELQRLLINKLRIKGMNSIFGLKIRISIGEKMLVGIATGTAMYLTLLPSPLLPKLVSDRNSDEKKLGDLKKRLRDTVKKNKEIYQLKTNTDPSQNYFMFPEYDDSEDELNSIDLLMGNKDCCILEIDDPQDAEVINLLMEDNPPDGFHVVNTETVPGLQDLEIVKNLQLFTQIYRAKINSSFNLHDYFRRILQSLYFKLRRMVPCALCDLQFRVDLPEADEIQLCVMGMALGLGKHQVKLSAAKKTEDELIFKLDEDQVLENSNSPKQPRHLQTHSTKQKQRSPSKTRHSVKQGHIPYKERHGVDITPLSYVPGGKIERYLGNLNFFFIRETTSIREEGGLSGFIHSFITEVLAIVRAHITALGGNAMVAYFLTEWVVNHNLHKNQGQCLINVGGDVVVVSYFDDDE